MSSPARLTVDVRGRARRIAKQALVDDVVKHVRRLLRAAGVADRECTLSLVDDDEILALNRQYAGEDHATDVLSFEQEAPLLGDIVISVETARLQARARGIELPDEIIFLAAHGVAHLQGLDHRNPREEQVMFAYTDRLLEQAYGYGKPKRIPLPRANSRRARKG